MKIENEEEQREINGAMWALNWLWKEHHCLELGMEDFKLALEVLKDEDSNRVERKFALEWLEDAYRKINGVYFTIGDPIDMIREAFYRLGFVFNVYVDDLDEDDPRWRGVWEGDRNT